MTQELLTKQETDLIKALLNAQQISPAHPDAPRVVREVQTLLIKLDALTEPAEKEITPAQE